MSITLEVVLQSRFSELYFASLWQSYCPPRVQTFIRNIFIGTQGMNISNIGPLFCFNL